MRTVRVKICGITREQDLAAAVEAGADAVGVLVDVPSSPRNITIEKARTLLRQVPVFVESVVVTAPQDVGQLVELYEKLKPSAIQIHGKKDFDAAELREQLGNAHLIKTIYVGNEETIENVANSVKGFDAVLLDSYTKSQLGGTGKVHDWTLSKQIKRAVAPLPVILAGGLNPDNVQDAILTVQPYAVDVASGVELRPAVKDHEKVRLFIEKAKEIKIQHTEVHKK